MAGSNNSKASGNTRESDGSESEQTGDTGDHENGLSWSYRSCDREYAFTPTTFTKRVLRLDERPIGYVTGKPTIIPWTDERLQNEYDALKFIAENTTIPVPRVIEFGQVEGGVYQLTVERIYDGVDIPSIEENRREEALRNADEFIRAEVLPQLRALKSPRIGTLGGVVIPPVRIRDRDNRPYWASKTSPTAEYVYCHNDLGQHNILMNWDTLEVEAIIDWEYSGFYPPEFEMTLWTMNPRERGYHDIGKEKVASLTEFLLDPSSTEVRRNWE